MTSDICTATAEGIEVQLEDKRDGQLYWVGKMKDDRCWMLQNLALGNSSSATTLTSADSNITSDWSLPAASTTASGSTSSTAIQSWNFGKWVLATPLLTIGCGTSATSISSCTRYGFVDVSDTANFQPTYTATTGTWNGATVTSDTLVAVNCTAWSGSGTSKVCTAGTYDPHYLIGNYYSWNAATAGTGGSITSGEASGSICPKGWELPVTITGSGDVLWTGQSTFAILLADYGVSSKASGTVDGITYNIAGAPLRFVRSGFISPGNGIRNAGQAGDCWSSTPGSGGSNAYRLRFDGPSVYPSDNAARYLGFSVRCVAEYTYYSSGGNNYLMSTESSN